MATLVTRSGKGSPLTHAEVDANFTNLNTDKLELSGGTMTGNLSFGDNDKAIFGAGSDLQIYHDGSDSYVHDAGTGILRLKSNGTKILMETAAGETLAEFINNGNAVLYSNNVERVRTNGTGIDVTGTVTADGLTVDGVINVEGNNAGVTDPLNAVNRIRFIDNDPTQVADQPTGTLEWYTSDAGSVGVHAYISTDMFNNGSGDMLIATGSGGSPTQSMRIGSGGDISFYEDTGTTAKFFWDASAESLGIGTSSPAQKLHVSGGQLQITNGGTDVYLNSSASNSYVYTASTPFDIYTSGSPRVRVGSTGNVGIGTTSPSTKLHVKSTSDNIVATQVSTNSVNGLFQAIESASLAQIGTSGAHDFTFFTSNQERMRIASYGSVGIGTSTPTNFSTYRYLDIMGSATGTGGVVQLLTSDSSVNLNMYSYSGGGVFGTATNHPLVFTSNNQERMRIDSSGNVGIGTSSPLTGLYSTVNHISGTSGGIILSSSASTFGIGSVAGVLQFYDSTNSSERMRIDSSGNLLVGKTALGVSTVGTQIESFGLGRFVRSGGETLILNRLASDGDILGFQKDGTTVGSIGSTGGDAFIGTGDIGLRFYDGSTSVIPWKASTNAISNGYSDLGHPSYRFKDLYLSGGVYLGGTGAANALDDYEFGTFTPTFIGSTSGTVTLATAFDKYAYTKVGRVVTITGRVDVSGTPSLSGNLLLQGLPFSSGNLLDSAGFTVQYGFITIGSSNTGNPIVVELQENVTQATLRLEDWTSAAGVLTNNSRIQMSITYFTN